MVEGHRHRPGSLHQSNKAFKSRHASKGAIKEKTKGKVNRIPVKQAGVKIMSKTDRRNAAKILRQQKQEALGKARRLFEGRHGTPKIVPVLSLCSDTDANKAIERLYRSLEQDPPAPGLPSILNVDRFKQKLHLVPLRRNFVDVMDTLKVADFIIVLLSAKVEVDKFGMNCLLGMLNQGVVNIVPVVEHMEEVASKLRPDIKKSLVSFVQQYYPAENQLFSIDTDGDTINLLRHVTARQPKPLTWRDLHPYMLAEHVEYVPETEDVGTLKVTGYARGNPFNANRLVHLQNFGDFQVQQICSAPLTKFDNDMETDIQVLDSPDPAAQDDLVSENEPDFMDNEQTWPTEEEMAEAEDHVQQMDDANTHQLKTKKRVPKGTSSYQASWIVDEEDEEYSSADDDDDDEEGMMVDDGDDVEPATIGSASIVPETVEEYDDIELESKNEPINELDEEEEMRQYEEYLQQRKSEFESHREFPDEIDTPMHIPARQRFARYRGLQSIKTSAWDPYENLPVDYSRIFQFENYKRTKCRVVSEAIVGNVAEGSRITLWIRQVPRAVIDTYRNDRPFIVFGLLQYEHKMTLLNFCITRDNAYEEPVRSKDPMVLHVGFRRYHVQPIYSQNTPKGTNNVHKFQRYLPSDRASIATVYGPAIFGKMPCMFYKETDSVNEPILVATGSFVGSDVKRVVAKRTVLSGHPFRAHKRVAVVRYMFFNPEDVMWFKPIQLVTKLGHLGHIHESLGTHGYMKCVFDGHISQQDTVLLCLYKRIFPKWNTQLWKGGLEPSESPLFTQLTH